MHLSLLPGIRERYAAASITVLLNDQILNSLSDFDVSRKEGHEAVAFPRKILQDLLVLKDGSLLEAHQLLEAHVQSLMDQKFDLCVDLTHSQISRLLAKRIGAPTLSPTSDSYLNEFFDLPVGNRFHYLDAIALTLGLNANAPQTSPPKDFPHPERPAKGKVLVQMLTSDSKKNYPLPRYVEFLKAIQEKNSQLQLEIICAPSEVPTISSALGSLAIPLNPCGWQEMESLLRDSSGLISLDTAALHLAARTGVWCFGIYLGSADPSKTGPYGEGHILVQSTVPCSPCLHRNPCERPHYECSAQLTPDALAETFTYAYRRDLQKLTDLAYRSSFQVFTSYLDPNGFFGLRALADENFTLRSDLSRCAHAPTRSDWNRLGEYPHWQTYDLLKEKELQFQRSDSWLQSLDKALLQLKDQPHDFQPVLDLCQEWIGYNDAAEWCAWLARELRDLKDRPSIEFTARIRYFYTKFANYLTMEKQILKNLVVLNARKGAFYVSGPPGAA